MGARHTGPRPPAELRRRRGTLCVRGRAVPACAGAPVSGAAGRLRRGAAVAGGGSRAVGHRPVPNCRGRHQRQGQSRRGARTRQPRGREPAPPIAGARLSRVALRLGHRIDARATSLRRARRRVVLVYLRTRTTARMPWPRRSSPSSAVCRLRSSSRPSTTRSATRGALRREAAAIGRRRRGRSDRGCRARLFSGTDRDDLRPEARRRGARSRSEAPA